MSVLRIGPQAVLLWAALVSVAHAQDVAVEASVEADVAVGAPAETPAQPAPGPAAQPARPRGPLPIMVVVLPDARVPDEVSAAASAALVAQLGPMAAGRPVHALGAEAMLSAIAACTDDACIGQQLASAGAQAGVLLRLVRGRRAIDATLELRDPVTGTLRREALEGPLPREAEGLPEALATLSAELAGAMPPPPPPPAMLLVTVNVDGARVQIDGQDIGEAPVAAVEVAEGSHEVAVTMAGYLSTQRRTEVAAGEQARVDVTLRAMGREVGAAAASGESAWSATGGAAREGGGESGELTEQWWFWTIIGGGGALLLGLAIGIGVAVGSQGSGPVDPQGVELPPITGGP